MTELSDKSIADRPGRTGGARRTSLPLLLGAAAAAWGLGASLYYARIGLTLSHYDAKAHLVVARRVIDSLTPGWLQIGAVWLPLPHVLNLLPVQVDAWYRTGASGVAISVVSFAALIYSAARLVHHFGGSPLAAVVSALLIATNPNLLYLQATPMTEPLLLGLLGLGLTELAIAIDRDAPLTRASVLLMLAVMTRYEAWPATAAAVAAVVAARMHQGHGLRAGLRDAARAALWPAVSVLWFLVHSKVTVGAWFVTGGFYVPDPAYRHRPLAVLAGLWLGLSELGSVSLAVAAAGASAALVVLWWRRRIAPASVVALAWLGVAALPAYAFFQGHPYRIRYMVPLVTASAILVPLALTRLPRARALAAVALLAAVWLETRPFDARAAMLLEAQWDLPKSAARRQVTACLPAPGGDETVMVSMGSLAHYMQELSHAGFALRDFVHEGNGDLWLAALERPRDHVRWILMEEVAEGGDMLAARARSSPDFLTGFTRTCEGGGVVLYRRSQ